VIELQYAYMSPSELKFPFFKTKKDWLNVFFLLAQPTNPCFPAGKTAVSYHAQHFFALVLPLLYS
jgi:hypothetical protein